MDHFLGKTPNVRKIFSETVSVETLRDTVLSEVDMRTKRRSGVQ